jgi:hypothetical protein
MSIKARLDRLIKSFGDSDLWGGADREGNAEEVANAFFNSGGYETSNPGIRRMALCWGVGCVAHTIAASRREPATWRPDDLDADREEAAEWLEQLGLPLDADERAISVRLLEHVQAESDSRFTDPELREVRRQCALQFKRGRREGAGA